MSDTDSDSQLPTGVDPQRLTALVEQAVSLQEAGEASVVGTVLSQVDESLRDVYREPLIARLEESMRQTHVTPADGQATLAPSDYTPEPSVELPPIRASIREAPAHPESIGKFSIKRELGRGACGAVYLGYDEELQREVAVKVSLVSGHLQDQLKLEAIKLAQIESKGIIPVYHVDETKEGQLFIVEKFVNGQPLRDLIRDQPISPALAARLIHDIAVGLEPAHLKEILHRDLKPENILVENNGHVWIADFGLAITEDEQQSRTRELAGTPPYMAPEQIMGRVDFLDARSDIWALGVMYYEMLTGKLPFNGKTRKSLAEQICEMDPRPLQQRAPGQLTEEMNNIFLRCCAKKPADRYPSVGELADDLDELMAAGLSDQNIFGEIAGEEIATVNTTPGTVVASMRTRRASTRTAYSTKVGTVDTVPPPKATSWALTLSAFATVIALAVGGVFAYQVYYKPVVEGTSPADDPSRGQATPPLAASLVDPTVDPANASEQAAPPGSETTGEEIPEPSEPANQLGLDLANGSQLKPWVVASDGSGSHRTISEAIAAGPSGAFIRVMPGSYDESMRITMPVTIDGSTKRLPDGEVNYLCEISNTRTTPMTIDCPDGQVSISNLFIAGEGHRSTKEFNAIDVVAGGLVLAGCELRTSAFNCVKLRNGSFIRADDCDFRKSRDFAISAIDDSTVVLNDCAFFSSGVQLVGGTGTIRKSQFYGRIGIYVSDSVTPVQVTDCEMETCLEYGIAVTNGGQMVASGIEMRECQTGFRIAVTNTENEKPGAVRLTRGRFEDCVIALFIQGGRLEALSDCRVQRGQVGLAMAGGRAELTDFAFDQCKDFGINAGTGDCTVKLDQCTFDRCLQAGIRVASGTLSYSGGRIRDCGREGIVIGEKENWPKMTASCTVTDVEISGSSTALVAQSGPIHLNRVTLSGGRVGMFAEGPEIALTGEEGPRVQIFAPGTTFSGQEQIGVLAVGDVRVELDEGALDTLIPAKREKALPPAEIIVGEEEI